MASSSAPSGVAVDAAAAAGRVPPATTLGDLLRLLGALAFAAARAPLHFSARTTFRTWARGAMARYGSDNLILHLGVTRLLLVGGPELSRRILGPPPSTSGFSTGTPKRKGMAALAPQALTVSDDEQWRRLRPFNETVLQAGRPHELRAAFLGHVHQAFSTPPATPDDIRRAMRRVMLPVVLGAGAPAEAADDVQALVALVQNPVKRILLGAWAATRRVRLYRTLRQLWDRAGAENRPTLLGRARRAAGPIPEEQALQQVPHWMFTFTGSGTDLLVRALTLVTSHPAALDAARREIAAAGPLDRVEAIDRLGFLEACLLESARLYPPVTRTFHCAESGAVAGAVVIPPGTEILHSFPLLGDPAFAGPDARRFAPERRTADPGAQPAQFDPFLAGARHCPGRELILFVCTSALAIMIGPQRLVADPPLAPAALPLEFPRRGIRFRS